MTAPATSADLRMSNEDRALVASLRVRQRDHDQISGAAADLIERLAPVPVIDGFGVGAWARMAQDNAAIIAELKARTVRVEDGPDGRGGDFSHEEPDPLAARAAEEIQRLTEELKEARSHTWTLTAEESEAFARALIDPKPPAERLRIAFERQRAGGLYPMPVLMEAADAERLAETQRELVEALHWSVTAADRLADVTPAGLLRTGIRAKAEEIRSLILKATGDAK